MEANGLSTGTIRPQTLTRLLGASRVPFHLPKTELGMLLGTLFTTDCSGVTPGLGICRSQQQAVRQSQMDQGLVSGCYQHQGTFLAPIEFPLVYSNRDGDASGDPILGLDSYNLGLLMFDFYRKFRLA